MANPPEVGHIHINKIEEMYWPGAAHELSASGYLAPEVLTVGPDGAHRILQPLPDAVDFDLEVRSHYAKDCGAWMTAVHEELQHLLEDIAGLMEKEKGPLAPAHEYMCTAEVLAHAIETFDFDIPAPYDDAYVPVNPKYLPATFCHRHGKDEPSNQDRAREIVRIVTACAVALTEKFKGGDCQTLAENLAALAESVANRKYPE